MDIPTMSAVESAPICVSLSPLVIII